MRLSELMRRSAHDTASPPALPRDPVLAGLTLDFAQGPARLSVRRPAGRRSTTARAFVADAVGRGAVGDPRRSRCAAAAARSRHRRRARCQSAPPRGADGGGVRRPAARHHRRRHRHQRQVLDRPFRAPDLGGARPQGGERRHARHRLAGPDARGRPDDARSGAAPRGSRDARPRGRRRIWRSRRRATVSTSIASTALRLSAAAFTNLTHEHLDYHASMDAYFAAKARLFDSLLPDGGTAVVNADSDRAEALAAICARRGIRFWTYGAKGREFRLLGDEPTLDRPASRDRGAGQRAMRSICRWSAASRPPMRSRRSASSWRPAAIPRAPWRRWRT